MAEQISASRADRHPHTEELWLDEENLAAGGEDEASGKPAHRLDTDEMLKLNRQLQSWYYEEREKQSVNRYQMAIDHDFYDSIQWSDEDAEEVESRGQAAIVYNETAPMVDWVCGTERRTRMDWKVLPRTPDDVTGADVKTKVMKFVSDINKVPFARSRAFDDAVKVGVGWLEDGARNDPTEDILFSRYESWRNVLWDSCGMELDLKDRALPVPVAVGWISILPLPCSPSARRNCARRRSIISSMEPTTTISTTWASTSRPPTAMARCCRAGRTRAIRSWSAPGASASS